MLLASLLLLVGVAVSQCKEYSQDLRPYDESDDNEKIVNGVAPRANSYPFVARLYITYNNEATYGCGGALINPKYVLTAAHCVVDDQGRTVTEIQVLLGAHNLRQNEPNRITRYADNFKTANYDARTKYGDVALIRLSEAVTYTPSIQRLCLAKSGTNAVRQTATVAGWGAIGSDMPSSNTLLHVQLPVLDDSVCKSVYGGYDNGVMLCAGYTDGSKDSCQGDSGGPLFVSTGSGYKSVGIVSYGYKCAEPGFPGVYAETQAFTNWIQQNTADGGAICVA